MGSTAKLEEHEEEVIILVLGPLAGAPRHSLHFQESIHFRYLSGFSLPLGLILTDSDIWSSWFIHSQALAESIGRS